MKDEFDPARGFDSPREALEYCNGFQDPKECFLENPRSSTSRLYRRSYD